MNIYLKIISKSIRLGKAFIWHLILFAMYLKDTKNFLKPSRVSLHKKKVFFKTITPYLRGGTTVLKVKPHYTYHLAWAGDLFFVVPVAVEKTKIEFNGHRIYSYADASMVSSQKYGCGCFWFRKRGAQK